MLNQFISPIQGADGHTGAVLSNGLITGQQYNITDLREVKIQLINEF